MDVLQILVKTYIEMGLQPEEIFNLNKGLINGLDKIGGLVIAGKKIDKYTKVREFLKLETENITKIFNDLEKVLKKIKSEVESQIDKQQKPQATNSVNNSETKTENYVYTGYPKNVRINMTSNGIGINLLNGELRYTKVPKNASIQMNNNTIKYFANGVQVFPTLISEEEAISLGATKPKIHENGTVSIGNSHFGGNSTVRNVYSGGSVHIGDVVGGVNFNDFGESNQQEVVEDGRIIDGIHTIDISKIKNLDRITGGVVTVEGNGTFRLDRITGGVVNIQSGVTVQMDRITGGVVNIASGAKVITDRVTGGIINGKNRITFERNTGAIIN